MSRHQRRHARQYDPYSSEFHLNRTVQCSDCGARLHKNHHFVYYGNRCGPCWQAFTVSSQENTASH